MANYQNLFNRDFYPTPDSAIESMLSASDIAGKTILEPSFGSGNIINAASTPARNRKVITCMQIENRKNNYQIKPNNMKEKIQIIRMVCGMLRKKNTGIILCRDSKNGLFYANGEGKDIAVEIAKVMGKDKSIREVFASGVLVRILADGSVPVLNESGLLNLKKILEKTIAEGGAR